MIRLLHSILLFLVRRIRSKHGIDTRRIACIELSRMGDVMAMLPAVQLLRRTYPSARLILVVRGRFAGFLRNAHVADEIVGLKSRNIFSIVYALRTKHITIVFSMSPATTNAVGAMLGAGACAGYLSPPKTLPGIIDRCEISAVGIDGVSGVFQNENIYRRGKKLCRAIGITEDTGIASVGLDPQWEQASLGELEALDLALHSPYIILHPFSGWSYRSWPVKRWRALIDMIMRRTDFECVLISSIEEKTSLAAIAGSGPRIHCAAGLPLEHLALLMKRCKMYIGNDSGPLHMAAALGVPVVGLYGPAAPAFTAPLNGGVYLFTQLECSPCAQDRCVRPDDTCMMQINHESVFGAIEKLSSGTDNRARERHC